GRLETLDEVPGDDPARQPAPCEPGHALGHALRTDPPQKAAQAHVRADEAQLALVLRQLQVVHTYDLGAVGVDDLLVEEVASEAERLGRKVRVGGVFEARAEAEVSDLLREVGPAHDLLTVRRGKDRPLSGRELTLRDDRDVRELTHLVAVRLDDPAVLYLRQVRHRAKAYSAAIRRGRGRAQVERAPGVGPLGPKRHAERSAKRRPFDRYNSYIPERPA